MRLTQLFALLAALGLAASASAGYVIEVDTDGLDDGVLTFGAGFAPGANTPAVSQSSPGQAVGLTPGSDSIFGGSAPSGTTTPDPDTYVYTYSPGADADNFGPGPGTLLNTVGDVVTGLAGGSGTYAAYAAWPMTTNVSNIPTNYVLNDGTGDIATVSFDQNGNDGSWVKLFEFELDPAKTYTLTQTNTPTFTPGVPGFSEDNYANGFVSMRASGVLFQAVPEPTAALLALIGAAGFGFARRK